MIGCLYLCRELPPLVLLTPGSRHIMNALLPLVLIVRLCLCREVPSDQVPINLLDLALRDWAGGQRGQQGEQEDWQHQLRMLVQSGVPMVGHVMHAELPVMGGGGGGRACWCCPSGAQGQGRVAGLAHRLSGVWHVGPAAVVTSC